MKRAHAEQQHTVIILIDCVNQTVDYVNHLVDTIFIVNATEVTNMLLTEWNWDDALAVRYEEGIEKGHEVIARNAIAKGVPLELINDISGIDINTLQTIQTQQAQ